MKERKIKSWKKPGVSPGTLIYTREKVQDNVSLQLIQYTEKDFNSWEEKSIEGLVGKIDKNKINWININGLHDTALIEFVGNYFGIHPLVLEDVLHTEHMPKLDDYDAYLFLTLKMLRLNGKRIEQEHISMILGDYFVITFQEKDGDIFDILRERLKAGKGRLRMRQADYLYYRLLDTVVDNYYLVTDVLEESLEKIEETLLKQKPDGISEKILDEKKKMISLRRSIIPLREEFRKFRQKEFHLIQPETYSFLDDVFDHLTHLSHSLDSFRDLTTSLLELQMAVNSNRMNDVMKTLTIYAAIFMPLTFIAGIYGMNFHRMPELGWYWGYPLALGAMAVIAIFMVFYMKRKKWM
ncbi:MAG: magnesium/cobalt transporter CorA [Bacteroidales bacterium]|nr:magnesium/cobalt transporter CorA [Bacteroidales bacterium]